MGQTTYIDSHCHLYFDKFDEDRQQMIARAQACGFEALLNIGIDKKTSQLCIELTQEYPGLCYAVIGLHPTETDMDDEQLSQLVGWIREQVSAWPGQVVGIGETGLDYYWDRSTPDLQKKSFRAHLALAQECSLPVVIHCRNSKNNDLAMHDCLEIVAQFPQVGGVFHCFGANAQSATRALELGWHISFAGNVSYPKATDLHEAAKVIPLERLLLETDAPFLAPQAKRGKRNEPSFALHTLDALAALKDVDSITMAKHCTENTRRLFKLKAGS